MSKKKKANNKKNAKKVKIDYKKEILLILLFFVVAGVIISTIVNTTNVNNKKENNSGVDTMELREFININLAKAMEKINNKDTFVLYIGYTGCQACENYNPILKRIQSQNESDTYYLDYKSIDKKSKNWKNLTKLIDIKQSLTITHDEKNIKINDKIGNIMKEYGYTPVTIYFVEGKCMNARIGSMSSSEIKEFLDINN